ncbi:hypothetical protein B0J18DRAFT_434994 [Chaetomium sp. MPI-SDFR-AT-0129]|nr:hypothetical protein B0J18DRAFT_434994 [Chaetomium sp. MPI-SDFR-AT-0129]
MRCIRFNYPLLSSSPTSSYTLEIYYMVVSLDTAQLAVQIDYPSLGGIYHVANNDRTSSSFSPIYAVLMVHVGAGFLVREEFLVAFLEALFLFYGLGFFLSLGECF